MSLASEHECGPYLVQHVIPSIAQTVFQRRMLEIHLRFRVATEPSIDSLLDIVQSTHRSGYDHVALRIHDSDPDTLECLNHLWGPPIAELTTHTFYPRLQTAPRIRRLYDVRAYTSEDLPEVLACAQNAFSNTRFYRDASFSKSDNLQLYEVLIRQLLCSTRYPEALVGLRNGRIAGFLAWKSWFEPTDPPQHIAGQGFLAVVPSNKGCAVAMVDASIELLSSNRDSLEFDSQRENVAATRIWERFGMKETRRQTIYHFVRTEQGFSPAARHPTGDPPTAGQATPIAD